MILRDQRGLALIDVLIVVLIVGIVAAILVPRFAQKTEKKNRELCRQRLKGLSEAELAFFERQGRYTERVEELIPLASGELSSECPMDGAEYLIDVDDSTSYTIGCPNGHGYIRNGKASWE